MDASSAQSPGGAWAALTLDEIRAAAEAGAVAVLPVGATEQHGSGLATGTDTILAGRMAAAAAARTGDVVLPALAYGCSLGHTDRWPGTLSLTPATMLALVAEVGRWAHASGFRTLVLVNGHGPNGPPCQSALIQLRHELPDLRTAFVFTADLTPAIAERFRQDAEDPHGNEAETSMLLAVAPGFVRPDRVVDEPDRTVGRVLQYPMPAVTRSGVVGRQREGSAERGEALFAELVDALADLLRVARAERDPELPGPG